MDSGATESVIGMDMLKSVEVEIGKETKRGARYIVANGDIIENQGGEEFPGS